MVKIGQTGGIDDERNAIRRENLVTSRRCINAHGVLHASAAAFFDLKTQSRTPFCTTLSEEVLEMADGVLCERDHGFEKYVTCCTVEASNTSDMHDGLAARRERIEEILW